MANIPPFVIPGDGSGFNPGNHARPKPVSLRRDISYYSPTTIFTNLHGWHVKKDDIHLEYKINSGDVGDVWKATVNGKVCAAKRLNLFAIDCEEYTQNSRTCYDLKLRVHFPIMKLQRNYDSIESAKADQAYKDLVTELAAMDSIKPHPNVVAFYGAFVEDPTEPILLEEYVDGESLKHFLEKRSQRLAKYLPARNTAWGWTLQLFRGLQHLHTSNPIIIHRDLKPGNVLLSSNREVLKITDFGTAKRVNRNERDTMIHTGRKSGNVMYMAPEVYHQVQGHYDERCDVFSAGLLAWRIATGQSFPPRTTWSSPEWRPAMMQVRWQGLADIIEKAWTHDPKSRPSCTQIVQELEAMPDKPDLTLGFAPHDGEGCCAVQ